MKADPFKDPDAMAGILGKLREEAEKLERTVTLMEVCGTHTHSVAGAGLRRLMP